MPPSIKAKRRTTRKKSKDEVEKDDAELLWDGFTPNPEAVAIAAELDRQMIERFNREELPLLEAEARANRKRRPVHKFDFSTGYIRRMTSELGVPTTPEEIARADARLQAYIDNLTPEEATILYNGFVHGIFPEEGD
jgi:hypothetical protein